MIFLVLQARQHRKFAVEEGDHLTMLNVYEAFVKVSQSGEIAGMGGTWGSHFSFWKFWMQKVLKAESIKL